MQQWQETNFLLRKEKPRADLVEGQSALTYWVDRVTQEVWGKTESQRKQETERV